MKLKLIFLYNNNIKETPEFDVEIREGCFFVEDKLLPFTSSDNNKQIITIDEYQFLDLFKRKLGIDVNAKFRYGIRRGAGSAVSIYAKLNWFQKHRLTLMFGEHYFQRDGNFKWLLGGICGFAAFILTYNITNQSNKIEKQNQEILSLKDSIKNFQKLNKKK